MRASQARRGRGVPAEVCHTPVVLRGDSFAPPGDIYLTTFGYFFDCHKGERGTCYWHPLAGGLDVGGHPTACRTTVSTNTRPSHTAGPQQAEHRDVPSAWVSALGLALLTGDRAWGGLPLHHTQVINPSKALTCPVASILQDLDSLVSTR